MKGAVIYARVSTDEQGKGYSLQTQVESCRKYCQDNGYAVVGVFTDEYTGTELDRPGLNELRKLVQAGHADRVVVHDLDRLARNVYFQLHLEREIGGYGVRIGYVLGQYKDTPEGTLLKRIKADIAEYENAQRVERCRRGKAGRVKAGYVIMPAGRAPFGYDYISEPHKGRLEVNEAQAAVVRQIYRWLVEDGLSSYAIAKRLWEQGVLSKGDISQVVWKKGRRGEWSPSTIRRIVSNPVYKGLWHYGKTRRTKAHGKTVQTAVPESEWIAVTVPSIVDVQTWERAQVCLAENRRNSIRNTKHEYLLRGMVFCACGRRWSGRYKNYLGRAYYRCPTTEAEHWRARCSMPGGVRQEVLEGAVWDAVANMLLAPENVQAEVERRRCEAASEDEKDAARLRDLRARREEIEHKMGLLLDQLLTGGFPKELVEQRRSELLAQDAQLRAEVDKLAAASQARQAVLEQESQVLAFVESIRRGLAGAVYQEKRRILELLGLRVDIITPQRAKVSAMVTPKAIVSTLSA